MGKYLSLGRLQQVRELEDNEYIENDKIGYIYNKTSSEIPNFSINGDELGYNMEAELSGTKEKSN